MENMIILNSGQKIDIVFQDNVTLDIDCALRYIKSGEAEIDTYVTNTAQPRLEKVINSAQVNLATAIAQGVETAVSAAESAATDAITQSISQVETAIDDYVSANITPDLNQAVTAAGNNASVASTSAENANNSAVAAANSASSAAASATASQNSASASSAVENRINSVISNAADEIFSQLSNPFSLLDYKYSEYELDNASWLLSNGQFNSGTVYQSVYDLLLSIYNGTTTKAGVSVKLSTETYANTDFVLNTVDETFRLPLSVALAVQGLYLYFYVGEVVQNANLIATGQALADIVDLKNADNFSNLGTGRISGLAMPSNRTRIDLTFGATGTTYVAPANGYFACHFRYSSTAGWGGAFLLKPGGSALGVGDDILGTQMLRGTTSNFAYFLPAQKGQVLYLNYSGMTSDYFGFIYAQGEN